MGGCHVQRYLCLLYTSFRVWRGHSVISALHLRLERRIKLVFKTTLREKFRYAPEVIKGDRRIDLSKRDELPDVGFKYRALLPSPQGLVNMCINAARGDVASEVGRPSMKSIYQSVSYTHLDVYKRQALRRERAGLARGQPGAALGCQGGARFAHDVQLQAPVDVESHRVFFIDGAGCRVYCSRS